jgi:hypothetical protein
MASKQVTDRQKSADSVIAAGEAHEEPVQRALADLIKPQLKKGEPLPDFGAVVKLSVKLLSAAKDRLVQADQAHETELSDDPPVREARDAAVAGLRDALINLREMIIGAYGHPTAAKLFLGAAPEDPVVLSRFAGEVADNLDKTKLPAPRIKGAKLDPSETSASLRDKRAQLDKHLGAVAREQREAQKTLAAKNAAIPAYDRTFAGVATTLSGLLLLAGETELAAKIRPSTRRPGQTAEDAGDEADPEAPPEK